MKAISDEEGVIVGAHEELVIQYPLKKLEDELYRYLKEKGEVPLSALWREFNCHLWELNQALKRLKEKGLVQEREIEAKHYHGPGGMTRAGGGLGP